MKLRIVTSNLGKVKEYQELFKNSSVDIEHCNTPYDEIQSYRLEDVVTKGISDLRAKRLTNFLVDDSGMFIEALNGFPGVYSAYVQKTIGNKGILKLMENVENRKASFKCSIGCYVNGEIIIVTGTCSGFIFQSEMGKGGFGYDPIFSPDGKKSFAAMSVEEKNLISHRGGAVKLLNKELINRRILNTKN